ncbi:hypothetical protein ABIC28_003167 [Rhodococcus sp. PvR044]|uniref:hypothetical protein n=1 Tax=Rhodococcus sp. PvR044 TaxID=3156402 RepID=UPI003393972B
MSAATCRMPVDLDGIATTPPDLVAMQPRPGTVPDDFEPVAAITCDPTSARTINADLTASFAEHRWEGDFSGAIAKLNAPSEGSRLDQGTCGIASMVAIPDLWLIDAAGRAIRPSYPVDECKFQRIGGLRAVEALENVGRVDHRVQLRPDGVEQLMGCGTVPALPVAGAGVLVPGDYSVRSSVCRYRFDAAGVAFAGAESLWDSLDPYFEALEPAPPCTSTASAAAGTSLSLLGPEYTAPVPVLIELDGCRRVLVDGFVPVLASPELLALVA